MEIAYVICEVESEVSYLFEIFHGRAMIQAVIRRPLIPAVRVQSQANTYKFCGGKSGTGTDLSEHSGPSLLTESTTISHIQLHITDLLFTKDQSQQLRWSRGSVLAFRTQDRGFKPFRSRRIFQGEKILSTPSFGREVKPSVPCRRFTACKRSLNSTWKSGILRLNLPAISRPHSSTFGC
jgi:hypothetical protein